jgi:pimeloyl-ACP methyl ester carboxylesterase
VPPAPEPIGGYPHVAIRALFWRYGLRRITTRHGIRLFRVRYPTLTPDGGATEASGLLALPRGTRTCPAIVSWQHGTASLRTAAPSAKDAANGLLPAAVFAGHGYALFAPDYVGYGVSTARHPYYLADHMAIVVRDGIVAARAAIGHTDTVVAPKLVLAGFSEGAHASLVAQRLIERDPVPELALLGTAPVAAAVDLAGAGLAGALRAQSRSCSLYLAWLATTYADHYGEPIADVLRPEWAAIAPALFDGVHDGDATVAALPADPHDLLTASFLAAYEQGRPHWFRDRLVENGVLAHAPTTPVRLYYGRADADVTPEQAIAYAAAHPGSEVATVCVGDLDHEETLLQALMPLRGWIDALTA